MPACWQYCTGRPLWHLKTERSFHQIGWDRQARSLTFSWFLERGPQGLTTGMGWVTEKGMFVNCIVIFFAGQTLATHAQQSASQSRARWVSSCSDRLPVIDWEKKPMYFLRKMSVWLCWNWHGFHKFTHLHFGYSWSSPYFMCKCDCWLTLPI